MTTDSKASDVNAKLIADLRALQSALYYGHELTGDEAPLLDLVIDILEARARQQPSAQWIATPEASVAEVMDALAEMALPHSPDTERTE